MARLVIAGSAPWSRRLYERWRTGVSHELMFIGARDELRPEAIDAFDPDFVFFLHWSWMIPANVYDRHACVVFHMTDLPYGRGGSPLQNLIRRGHQTTKLSAIRVVADLDAGPVYLKRDLSLSGNAEEIYERATALSLEMIDTIVEERPEPVEQSGEAVVFRRRKPEESRIATDERDLDTLFDFIRMLDAETYPHAFLEYGPFRMEFSSVTKDRDSLRADVVISVRKEES